MKAASTGPSIGACENSLIAVLFNCVLQCRDNQIFGGVPGHFNKLLAASQMLRVAFAFQVAGSNSGLAYARGAVHRIEVVAVDVGGVRVIVMTFD